MTGAVLVITVVPVAGIVPVIVVPGALVPTGTWVLVRPTVEVITEATAVLIAAWFWLRRVWAS